MMKILGNRILLSTVLLFLLNVAGGLILLAPILVFLRNELGSSASTLLLWPAVSPSVVVDFLLNYRQALAVFAASAMVIYILYFLLRILFMGGVYHLVIFKDAADRAIDSPSAFISRSTDAWPGFLKVALLAVVVYGIALFLGVSFGRLLGVLPTFWRLCIVAIFALIGSTFLQILRAKMISENSFSLRKAIRATRPLVAGSALRLIAGNISVAAVGISVAFVLWSINKGIRGNNWNFGVALLSFILQQTIVFTICLMQVVRINFNQSVIRKGAINVMGRTELG
jgi:hypothetical protein